MYDEPARHSDEHRGTRAAAATASGTAAPAAQAAPPLPLPVPLAVAVPVPVVLGLHRHDSPPSRLGVASRKQFTVAQLHAAWQFTLGRSLLKMR